ncbi:MAG: hypothetical protein ACYDC0_11205 [Acidimicrobiales bacterium]
MSGREHMGLIEDLVATAQEGYLRTAINLGLAARLSTSVRDV